MNFKIFYALFYTTLILLVCACGDAAKEKNLVDRHTTASQDVIDISFPSNTTETIHSINSEFDFSLLGLKSNGVDLVSITRNVEWSLSEGATSHIDQNGHFTASVNPETITLSAKLGFLSESIDIRVSSAKFDQVVKLDEEAFDIDMCRSRIIKPIGRYEDENGGEEIRLVDNIIINTIEWIIRNQEDNALSQRAYIETSVNQATLNALEAGEIIIQAQAPSVLSGIDVTSVGFNQQLGNGLNTIKLCRSSDSDLANCEVTSASVEKDQVLSLIAVGNYQVEGGSSINENISGNSKWGINNNNAAIVLSDDQIDITGVNENTTASVSVACGNIEQTLTDIPEDLIQTDPASCGSNINCETTFASINITQLSVQSLDVSANGIALISDQSITLDQRPSEISLIVNANFVNGSQQTITDDAVYTIIPIDGQDVIEAKTGSNGIFTALAAGTAKIQLDYRGERFIVEIEVP